MYRVITADRLKDRIQLDLHLADLVVLRQTAERLGIEVGPEIGERPPVPEGRDVLHNQRNVRITDYVRSLVGIGHVLVDVRAYKGPQRGPQNFRPASGNPPCGLLSIVYGRAEERSKEGLSMRVLDLLQHQIARIVHIRECPEATIISVLDGLKPSEHGVATRVLVHANGVHTVVPSLFLRDLGRHLEDADLDDLW